MIFYQCALLKAEPGSRRETPDALWEVQKKTPVIWSGMKKDLSIPVALVPHEPGIDFFFMVDVMVPAHIDNNLFDNPSGKKEGRGIIR
jgi:hypothetical protein